jgi:hypothetical protein
MTQEPPAVGRELDIEIARLQGWTNIFPPSDYYPFWRGAAPDSVPDGDALEEIPAYSSDPATAFALLEWIMKQAWCMQVTMEMQAQPRVVIFTNEDDSFGDAVWYSAQNDICAAIALASWKAMTAIRESE